MQIDVVADVKTIVGEGPLWDVETQRLYWVDIFDRRVFRTTFDGREIRAWDVPMKIGCMALRRGGDGAIVGLERGFHLLDFRSGTVELIEDPEPDKPANRINDGKVDKQGRFVAGSMETQKQGPSGALYRVDADLSVHRLEGGFTVPNGPCWSPDGGTFYVSDSWSGEIRAYAYDQLHGTIGDRRTFVRVDASDGAATDGATVDAEGCVWNALAHGGRIVRYTPSGEVERVIEMPVKKVTSVMFGGPNLDILYVTSMAKPAPRPSPDDGVLGGSLFAITGLGVEGLPESRFAG
ncbi:MAG: SMP-30/gluconolactonase/LRE family protein [Devosia sp.]|nr:SMP-30/gluconolactonase/LRE family protein [Devosia sp.]OJX47976.1 MAG: calcium-binding protein [Devosia sp. 66-22]